MMIPATAPFTPASHDPDVSTWPFGRYAFVSSPR